MILMDLLFSDSVQNISIGLTMGPFPYEGSGLNSWLARGDAYLWEETTPPSKEVLTGTARPLWVCSQSILEQGSRQR